VSCVHIQIVWGFWHSSWETLCCGALRSFDSFVLSRIIVHTLNIMYKRARSWGYQPAVPFKRARVYGGRAPGSVALRSYKASNKHYGRGVSRTGTVIQQIRALQRFVGTLKPEIKYWDTAISAGNLPVTGTVDHITNIDQGDTVSTRTGNAVNIVSVTLKGTIVQAQNGSFYRVALVQDKQQVADTAPTASAIFSDGIASANPVTAVPTIANASRFNVLWMSKIYDGTVINSGNQIPYYEMTKKLNLKVIFNGVAGTDIEKNGLYVVFLTDAVGGTADFNGLARLGFTDS